MTFPIRTTAVLAVLAACACAACTSLLTPARMPRTHPTGSPAPGTASPAPPGLAALLPISPAQLHDASALAARFTTAYATHPPGQSPAAWLARLRPMATSQLAAALARTAATPGLWQHPWPAAGRVAGEQIRDLTPGSVLFTLRLCPATGTAGCGTLAAGYAVTLTRQPSGWAVYDIEPTTAGNTG